MEYGIGGLEGLQRLYGYTALYYFAGFACLLGLWLMVSFGISFVGICMFLLTFKGSREWMVKDPVIKVLDYARVR